MDRVGILIELIGNQEAIRSLRELNDLKNKIKRDNLDLRFKKNNVLREVNEIRTRLNQLYREKRTLSLRFDRGRIQEINREIQRLTDRLHDLQREAAEFRLDINQNNIGVQAINQAISEARTLRDVLGSIGSVASGIGSGLQRLGSIFDSSIGSYMKQYLTWGVTGQIIGNMQNALTRFDTLKTYAPYMAIMGISAEDASDSLEKVNKEIQGLPLGLDEVAFQVRRYTMFLGQDAEKATNLVIGLNKALIAGGAPSYMRTTATYEIERLLATGELATARQWMALLNGMGISTTFLKDALGRADMSLSDFVKEVTSSEGEISGTDFLEGVMNLADDKRLDEAIDIYKSTLESGMSNVHFALVRGIEHIFTAMDDTFMEQFGLHISDYIMEGRDMMDAAFQGIVDWINNNPDEIIGAMERVRSFFDRLTDFDWVSLGENVFHSLETLFDIFKWIYDHIPQKLLNYFLVFTMVWASPIGKAFSAFGSLFTALSRIPVFNIGRITPMFKGFGTLMTTMKDIGKGFVGATAFLGIIAEIGAVVFEFTKIAEVISKADLGGLDKNLKPVINFFANGGALATILTGIFSLIGSNPVTAGAVGIGELLAGGFVAIIGEIGAVIGEFTDVAGKIASVTLPSSEKVNKLANTVKSFSSIFQANVLQNVPSKWKLKRLTDAIVLIADIADSIDDIDTIANANIDTTGLTETIETITGAMKAIDDAIVEALDGESILSARGRTHGESKVVENMHELLASLTETLDSFDAIRDKLNEYGFFNDKTGGNDRIASISETMEALVTAMSEISASVSESSDIFGAEKEKIVTGIREKIIESYNEIVGAIKDLVTLINDSKDVLHDVTKDGTLQTLTGQMSDVLDSIKEMLSTVSDKVLLFEKAKEAKSWSYIASKIDSYKLVVDSIVNIAGSLFESIDALNWVGESSDRPKKGSFSYAIESLKDIIANFAEIDFETLGNMEVGNLKTNVESIKTALVTLIQLAPELLGIEDELTQITDGEVATKLGDLINSLVTSMQSVPADMEDVAGRVELLENSVTKLSTFVSTLAGLKDNLDSITSGKDSVVSKIKKLIEDLTSAFSVAGDETGPNFTAIATGIQSIVTAFQELNSIDLGSFKQRISNAGDAVDKLKKRVNTLAEKMKDASKQANVLKEAINQLAQTAENKSGSFTNLIGAVRTISTAAYGASTNVWNLVSAVNNLTDKTITITVNTPGLSEAVSGLRTLANRASSVASSVTPEYVSRGGKIAYLADGGTPFKPRGSDTVPAMLTPGEWVINRHASRVFGDKFMQRINAMDIPGAMDALMSRSRWVPNGGFGNYTTNNYDSHAVVNQYFPNRKDSRPSYRRASRYLGAL